MREGDLKEGIIDNQEPLLEKSKEDVKTLGDNIEKNEDITPVDPKYSRRKNPPPPGMTLSAYKRQLRREKLKEHREEWSLKQKEKRKKKKLEKRKLKEEGEIEGVHIKPKRSMIRHHVDLDVIIDCGFDEMMKPEELTSLGSQIIRCYSDNKKSEKYVNLKISSFNKSLKERFTTVMKNQHLQWKNVEIIEDDYQLPANPEELKNWVYLSSDSSNLIETLEPQKTYIIGGIVDRGRYKNLCKDKAEKQGIQTGRLPIDEYIKVSGRRVLTTNHVFEILLEWLITKDWKLAFENVIPPRKLLSKGSEENVKTSSQLDNLVSENTQS